MSTALATLTSNFATRFGLGNNQDELMVTLKATAFKGQVSDAQMTTLMLVAQQYNLNPWTREIYAFPDKNNGIVPVVGVDGWSRIMNEHPQMDGMEFKQDDESCTCIIYRKDRSHPISATEYMSECKRTTGPWSSHPKRMLRHKAMIQAARLAFGFGGIYDQDEAERIVESTGTTIDHETGEITKPEPKPLPPLSAEEFTKQKPKWQAAVVTGKKTAEAVIAFVNAQNIATLTPEQIGEIKSWPVPKPVEPEPVAKSAAIDEDDIPF